MRKKIKILHLEDRQPDAELTDHVRKKGKINYRLIWLPAAIFNSQFGYTV